MPDISQAEPLALANSLMGMLFAKLTGGDNELLKDRRHFFMWLPAGMPVDPSEWDFMTGIMRSPPTTSTVQVTSRVSSSGEGATEEAVPQEEEAIPFSEGDAARFLLRCAETFAFMTDFVPDVSGILDLDSDQQIIAARRQGATLTGEYERILDECVVANDELSEETQARIRELQGFLTVSAEVKDENGDPIMDPLSGEPMVMSGPSQFVKAYNKFATEYHQAWTELNNLRVDLAASDDPVAIARASAQAPIMEQKVHTARQMWESAGFRGQVEGWRAEVERLTVQSMLSRWAELRTEFETTQREGLSMGKFHWAQVGAPNVLRSGGWTRYELSQSTYERFDGSTSQSFNADVKVRFPGLSSLGIKGEHESEEERTWDNVDRTGFSLEFELTEVPIYRPVVDMNFLLNDRWKLPPGADVLSDGGNPPEGSMVAAPTFIILVRNVKMTFEELKKEGSTFREKLEQGGSIRMWPLNLGGSVSRGSEEVRNRTFIDKERGSISVDGAQIVGFRCQMLPKAPNPDPSVSSWVGPGGGGG